MCVWCVRSKQARKHAGAHPFHNFDKPFPSPPFVNPRFDEDSSGTTATRGSPPRAWPTRCSFGTPPAPPSSRSACSGAFAVLFPIDRPCSSRSLLWSVVYAPYDDPLASPHPKLTHACLNQYIRRARHVVDGAYADIEQAATKQTTVKQERKCVRASSADALHCLLDPMHRSGLISPHCVLFPPCASR